MDYFIVIVAVAMFGGCFALNDAYRKLRSSSMASSMESSFVGSLAALFLMLVMSGFHFEVTPFTLIIAFLASLNDMAFTYFSFRSLDSTNLSMYSLFSMLGGMALPFCQGILFYGEAVTVSKVVCFVFVFIALVLTVSRDKGKKGTLFYASVFVLNGMAGVLTKSFTSAPYEKASAEAFSAWICVFTAVLSGVLWIIFSRKENMGKYTWKAFSVSALNGSLNRIANFLLVIALVSLDASVQYPLVTGGVIIVSTLISCFTEKKPSKREICAVVVAFLGTLSLFLIRV